MSDDDTVYPALRRRSQNSRRGYPMATIAFYGSDGSRASKVAVGVVPGEGAEASHMQRWTTAIGDIRRDPNVGDEVLRFLKRVGAGTVVICDGIIGCPHEEGIDYPEGEACPECPFWRDRDRWTGEVIS